MSLSDKWQCRLRAEYAGRGGAVAVILEVEATIDGSWIELDRYVVSPPGRFARWRRPWRFWSDICRAAHALHNDAPYALERWNASRRHIDAFNGGTISAPFGMRRINLLAE